MKSMRYALLIGMVLLGLVTLTNAANDIQQAPACKYCGMDRQAFAHSRMHIEYDDGTHEGFCSIHCAAVDLAVNIDKIPKALFVGDYKTKDLIDAEQAVWVIGGSKPGVMTKRAKWAFKTKGDAEAFIKEFGGSYATFEEAMKASYDDMYQDSKMIREKRAMKRKTMEENKAGGHSGT